ncbi:MAG: hypothetical protein ACT4OF_05680 [Caulobacteraceae bacterium]
MRHIKFTDAATLDDPNVAALIDQALVCANVQMPRTGKGPLAIRSISAKQRPRRP